MDSVQPIARLTLGMGHGENADLVTEREEYQSIREPRQHRPTDIQLRRYIEQTRE